MSIPLLWVTVLAAQAVPAALPPEWSAPLPTALALEADPQEPRPGVGRQQDDFGLTAGAKVRWTVPFGAADRDLYYYSSGGAVVYVDSYISWADLFDPGWGVELEVDVMLGWQREFGNISRYGIYVVVEQDEYYGDSVTGELGGRVKADDLTMSSVLVGAKMVHPIAENAVAGGRMGIGAVHYSQVMGEFSGPLITPFRDEFLEDTWTFAFEIRGQAGLKLGPLVLSLGLGLRINAPPRDGDIVDFSSGAFWTFDVDLGAEIGF
jgi:hypothetical protein